MSLRRELMMRMAGNAPFKKVHSITVESGIDYTIDFYNLIKTYDGYVGGKTYVYRIIGNTSTDQNYKGIAAIAYYHSNDNALQSVRIGYVRQVNTTSTASTQYNFSITANSIIEIYEVQD